MRFTCRLMVASFHLWVVLLFIPPAVFLFDRILSAQVPAAATANTGDPPQALNWTAAEDHKNMMDQLGIKALRPGPSGNENALNHANYDESLANPFPNLPDVLVLKNGAKVTSADSWWKQRRPEIVEDFEREIYGRIPGNVPKVNWTVTGTVNGLVGTYPVVGKQLVGRVDNASCPAINVDIQMIVVTPGAATRPVPVMMMFGRGGLPQPDGSTAPPERGGFGPPAGSDPPATRQLIADGWGYVFINPGSIQADNGAGLTKGVIGLVNKGRPRKPDDWGALRAWAWGASRGLDYLETDKAVDAGHVGIEGVSRFGKAALVTMAFDTRFAVVLVGSSGEGGAKLHRRNWGEAVENLTGSGEYHWMAGNFLKYGAAEAVFGSKNAGDLPVDAHELIALCAPRPTFISYGVPEKGDAKWLDQLGSYMATVAAGPVFRLLGSKDLGVSDDYRKAKLPPVNEGRLDGQLAWRQHDGGHNDGPNWKYFIAWANKFIGHTALPSIPAAIPGSAPAPADVPTPRTDQNSLMAHTQLLEKARQGRIDIYFEGDSITRRWGATDYPELLANWKQNFFGWNAADFGWGADRIQNILWRLDNGELDGVNPKVIVLLAGTNNVGSTRSPEGDDVEVADITKGFQAILRIMQSKAPGATIIVTAIFPRNDNMAVMPTINRINDNLARLAEGQRIRFINVNDKLADRDGRLFDGMMNAGDKLHPTVKGYQVWADALKPVFTELLGPPGKEDHAPPPTGDPSARRPVGGSPPHNEPDLSRHFKGIQGTFVLLDGQTGRYTRYDAERAARRFAPCSTFKIPNTAIALESGVAADPDFTLKYDPALKQEGDWARDHSLRSAFKFSVVWYYQEIARRVGPRDMTRFAHQFGYGNEDISGGIDRFWLGSTLRISADEQVRFLERLYQGRLGLSERTTRLVKEIMLVEQTPDWRLSGKTGACRAEGEDVVLWYVGFVEKGADVYYFALEMGDREYQPLYAQRITRARAILTDLDILTQK